MSSSASVYSIVEAEPPSWKPGEELAASAFVGMSLLLAAFIFVSIFRTFRRKRGLYFWSILLGGAGVIIDATGIILKFFTSTTTQRRIWPLYTTFLLSGWSLYAPMQLFILYCRLHLINQNKTIRNICFWSALSTYFVFIIPTWITIWPSYNVDLTLSRKWSPADAILERITQIGFTLVEAFISGVYILSLIPILKNKPTVRQRRVFLDLIIVNIINISFDVMTVLFVYLNQTGLSHPIQTFTYGLKLFLEFQVLNQLMAVAAIKKRQPWANRRYVETGSLDTSKSNTAHYVSPTSPRAHAHKASSASATPFIGTSQIPNTASHAPHRQADLEKLSQVGFVKHPRRYHQDQEKALDDPNDYYPGRQGGPIGDHIDEDWRPDIEIWDRRFRRELPWFA